MATACWFRRTHCRHQLNSQRKQDHKRHHRRLTPLPNLPQALRRTHPHILILIRIAQDTHDGLAYLVVAARGAAAAVFMVSMAALIREHVRG